MTVHARLAETNRPLDEDACWRAIQLRDGGADGAFFSCVSTTGVFCRPSCAGRPLRANVSFVRSRMEAERLGYRPCRRCRPERIVAGPVEARLSAVDWDGATASLASAGFSRLGFILSTDECDQLASGFTNEASFRASVDMKRRGLGEGVYRYYADPTPPVVAACRAGLYRRLAPIANASRDDRLAPYPASLAEYRKRCAASGQTLPTPLLLRYAAGGYNRLHRDIYGGEVFPLQVVIALSEPDRDYAGGLFLLAAQETRRQTRVETIALGKGEALAFWSDRWRKTSPNGVRTVRLRHGLSTIERGERYALGVIFHDAA